MKPYRVTISRPSDGIVPYHKCLGAVKFQPLIHYKFTSLKLEFLSRMSVVKIIGPIVSRAHCNITGAPENNCKN